MGAQRRRIDNDRALGLRRRRVDVLVAPPPVRGRRLEHVPAGKGRSAVVRARAGLDRGLAVGHAQHSPGPVPLAAPLVVDIGEVGTRGAGRPEKVLLIVVPRWWDEPALGRGRGRLDGVGAEKRRDGDCSGRDHGCGQQAGQNDTRAAHQHSCRSDAGRKSTTGAGRIDPPALYGPRVIGAAADSSQVLCII